MPLRLLSLPSNLLDLVIRFQQFPELYHLAQCSTATRLFIKQWFLRNTLNNSYLGINYNANGCGLHLFHGDLVSPAWFFRTPSADYRDYDGDECSRITLEIAGRPVEFKEESGRFYHVADHFEPILLDLLEDCIDLFDLSISFIWLHLKHVVSMEPLLKADWLWQCNRLLMDEGTMEEHAMTSILSNLQCNNLHFRCEMTNPYDSGSTITVPHIDWYECPLSRRQLCDMSCNTIKLFSVEYSDEDYNAFVKSWMCGDDEKLEYLETLVYRDSKKKMKKLDPEKILEGIQWYPMREIVLDDRHVKVLDVIRVDGQRARLLVENNGEQLIRLKFMVGHE